MLVDKGKLLLQPPSELSCVLPLALSPTNQLLIFVDNCAALRGKLAFVFRQTAIDGELERLSLGFLFLPGAISSGGTAVTIEVPGPGTGAAASGPRLGP